MPETQIGDQTIRYDRDATAAIYQSSNAAPLKNVVFLSDGRKGLEFSTHLKRVLSHNKDEGRRALAQCKVLKT
jgi:hypothetical protein